MKGLSDEDQKKIKKCSALVARAVVDANNKNLASSLFSNDEDVELGYFLADKFISALVYRARNKVKTKLFDKKTLAQSFGWHLTP